METPQQIIEKEFAELPTEMREVLGSFDWIKTTTDLGKENGLSDEESDDLLLETFLTLIGAVDLKFYAINIENHVETTKDKAEKIAKEVFEKVFVPIKQLLDEKIKQELKNKKVTPLQTLNFILSGGDYSAFMTNSPLEEYPLGGGGNTSTPSRKLATPQEGNINPPSLQDIKNKLAI